MRAIAVVRPYSGALSEIHYDWSAPTICNLLLLLPIMLLQLSWNSGPAVLLLINDRRSCSCPVCDEELVQFSCKSIVEEI